MRHEIRSPLKSKNRGCPCERESKSPFPFICFCPPPTAARYFLPITDEEPRNSCPSKQPESCLDPPDPQRVLQQNTGLILRKGRSPQRTDELSNDIRNKIPTF
ncbi:hypothetical protein CDAR_191321 [Caerostris darwini]|uniref:Uncharacterized protein n=1 Tax=Caerostris darwini TaxID=1538125 RepID=A0AAV4VEV1_9ARAC|nr:hypothetical protein CDAR_191321 [Caerostris darwini]